MSPGPAEPPTKPAEDLPHAKPPISSPKGWARFLFVLSKVPRMIALFQEFWGILVGTPEEEFDAYIQDFTEALRERRAARTPAERKDARRNLSDLIHRL